MLTQDDLVISKEKWSKRRKMEHKSKFYNPPKKMLTPRSKKKVISKKTAGTAESKTQEETYELKGRKTSVKKNPDIQFQKHYRTEEPKKI